MLEICFHPELKSARILYNCPGRALGIGLLPLGVPSAACSSHCLSLMGPRACLLAPRHADHWVSLLIACETPPAPERAQALTAQGAASPFLKEGELLEGMLAP